MATTAAPRFEALLRRARARDRLAPLLRALGFDPDPLALEPAELGLDPADVAALARVAERGGLDVLLLETPDAPGVERVAALARRIRVHNPARPRLLLVAGPGYRRLVLASFGLEGELRQLVVDRRRPRATDLETLEEMAAAPGEGGTMLALRHARALDRTRVTRGFFRDFRAQRDAVAAAWRGAAELLPEERARLALLLLCRLMFLYFLQRRGQLAGDPHFVPRLLRRRSREGRLYRSVLEPLFFGALNTRPEARSAEARALGPLPYLNGGLFERTALERRCPDLELGDAVLLGVLDALLERYRFTAVEAGEAAIDGAGDVGVDPEMLGRVFEGLMASDHRSATGTFYTPAPVVDRVVRETLAVYLEGRAGLAPADAAALARGAAVPLVPAAREALERALSGIRVLDPACGSGAFLLGALARLARLRAALGADPAEARRSLVAGALHGVDVQEDAALLCALRLWLALAVGDTEPGSVPAPLPSLDRRIRQGDALLDPLDLAGAEDGEPAWRAAAADGEVRHAVAEISTRTAAYIGAEPGERPELQRRLAAAEAELARAWLTVVERRVESRLGEARARAEARDLFGERAPDAVRAGAEAARLEKRLQETAALRTGLEDQGALPFFSFDVHFAGTGRTGFDLILSNPPWVRAHGWPAAVARLVRGRSRVCRESAWRPAALAGSAGGQVDLSLLFLERSIRMLAPGGTLGMLLPAKAIRSLYAAGARRLLLEDTEIAELEDHSLDQRSVFRADAFTAVVVARRRGPAPDGADRPVRVTLFRRGASPLRFALSAHDLPLVPGDAAAPWLLVPPGVRAAMRRMQRAGPPLGSHDGMRIRRGMETGANDVLLLRGARAGLGGLAAIRAQGHDRARRAGAPAAELGRFEAWVEAEAVRPVARGADVRAWRCRTSCWVLWPWGPGAAIPPRAARYLALHEGVLPRRSPRGVGEDEAGPRVAWRDIGRTLEAVALPARAAAPAGQRPLMPLNTVYYVPVAREEEALILAAVLNSTPLRAFARAVAERAKDAHFRFFAWTVALLPLPVDWRLRPGAAELLTLSRRAHEVGGLGPEAAAALDRAAASLYGLSPDDMDALAGFDRWLSGEETP